MNFRFILFLLALLGPQVVQAGFKIAEKEIAPGVFLVGAEFGIYVEDGAGRVFKPTDTVPLINGLRYGWRLKVRTSREWLNVREEFKLPSAPLEWQTDKSHRRFRTKEDETFAESTFYMAVWDGALDHWWGVLEGDPIGEHTIRVFVEGQLAHTFIFRVIEEKPPR